MKKVKLLITRNLKPLLVAAAVVGFSFASFKHSEPSDASLATFAILASLKKKGVKLSADDEKYFTDLEEAVNAAFKELTDGVTSKADIDTLITEKTKDFGKGLSDEEKKSFDDMIKSVKDHATELEKLKDAGVSKEEVGQTFYSKVKAELEKHKDDLENASKTRDGGFRFSVKAADSLMTTGYVTSAPNSYLPMPTVLPGVKETPEQELNILQLVNTGTSDSPSVTWVNEKPVDGDAAYTAEGELKSQVSWKYENETAKSSKITAFVKVTTQSLRNISWLANRINSRLRYLLLKKVENGIIKGDGVGEALSGITEYAPAYTTTSFNDSVENPNTMDAIVAASGQVEELGYTADICLMNGVEVRKMKLTKNKNGDYILPPFTTANGTYIDNMRVVRNKEIAVGKLMVGDFQKSNVLMVEDITLDVGLDGDDFTKNRRTILGEIELMHFISDIEKGAFVYDDIATIKTAIDAAV